MTDTPTPASANVRDKIAAIVRDAVQNRLCGEWCWDKAADLLLSAFPALAQSDAQPASADVNEGMREALAKIERGITSVRLDAALKEQPISREVFEQVHKDVLAVMALARSGSGWSPIDSAPKDGSAFLWCEENIDGNWYNDDFVVSVRWPPTAKHRKCFERGCWMPMPAPPRALALPDSPTTHKGGK